MKARTPPRSVRILNQWVDSHARQLGQPPARVRNWLSFIVLGGALETAGFEGAGRKFTIKGGVALELRLRHLARATKDLDLILDSGDGDLIQELEGALSRPYQGFSFRLKGQPELMPNGAARIEVALQYLGKGWGTVQVDVARHEGDGAEVEMVEAISLAPFGIAGPDSLPCLSLPFHLAQKIHGMTLPPPEGRRNERFRDLVDLLLLRGGVTDLEAVRSACLTVFASRGTHSWPPRIEVPEHWTAPFAAMAQEVGLHLHDVHSAAIEARQFLNQIEESATWYGDLPTLSGLTATTWYYVVGRDGEPTRIPASDGENLFIGHPEPEEIPSDWQRDPGGVAVVGIVLLLRNRTPAYVEGKATKAVALRGDIVGRSAAFEHRSFRAIAVDILRRARTPEDSADALAVFLEEVDRELPCQAARRMFVTTAQANWYRVHWRWEWFLWDIAAAQPVSGSRPG